MPRRRSREDRALLLDDPPGRQLGRQAAQRRRLAPDFGRKLFAPTVDEPAVGIGEQALNQSVDDAENRRLASRGGVVASLGRKLFAPRVDEPAVGIGEQALNQSVDDAENCRLASRGQGYCM